MPGIWGDVMAIKPKRPWVLLRGLGREGRHWGEFPLRLSDELGGIAVLTPDLPGNGRRWKERSALSVADQCAVVRAEFEGVLAQGPVNVLAISLGGMVALEWAGHYPEEIKRLVLVNTSLAGLAPFWRRVRWQRYPALLSLLGRGRDRREAAILNLLSNSGQARAMALDSWQRWQAEAPVSKRNLLRQLAAAARYRPPANWPPMPCLLLASERDRLVDPYCSHALAAATDWPLHLHPSAGHDLPLDDAVWLAKSVAQWARK